MRLSRTVAYAIQAVMELSQHNPSIAYPCSKLAQTTKMPERYLLQIMRQMTTHGILYSTRGVDGGYTLMKKTSEISLLEIIEAIDGPVILMMPIGDKISSRVSTKLGELMKKITDNLAKQLAAIKISELMGPTQKGR